MRIGTLAAVQLATDRTRADTAGFVYNQKLVRNSLEPIDKGL